MNKNLLIALGPRQSDPPEREHIAGKGWRLEWAWVGRQEIWVSLPIPCLALGPQASH